MVSTLIAALTPYLGAFGATFVVNYALSYVVTRAFADNPETQQDMGVRQQVPPSAVNAIPIVYGNAYMGGTFIDAVLTTDQKTMYYVLAISSISPNGQFTFDRTDMYYGDRKITFDGSDLTKVVSLTDEAGNVDTKISGNLYISLYTSTAGGTITSANGASAPSTVMGGSDIASAQRWTGTRQMNGLGFAIVKLIYNRDADTTQLQPITFKVAHTLNGTGVAKPGDVWYDYMTNTVYGGAVDTSFVNSASATDLNTYSDELITFTNSSGVPSTQARYRINGVLDAGQSVLSNVDRIMSACDSWLTYNAAFGQWSVVVNKAESAAYAFNDSNIIGEIRVSASDITSSINQVEARFPFKENRDQAAFVNIETPDILLYPNEPVNKYSITYDMVNESVQAHYLANRLLEQAREDLIVSFSTTYYGIQVDAGNVISVTNSDYGWSNKLFRVMKVNEASLPDGSLGARFELSEYNSQVYDDQDITQFTTVPNSNLVSPVYFSALNTPTVTGNPSATVPNFSVQVFIPVTGRVTFGNLFYTTSATPAASDWKLLDSFSTSNSQPIGNNFNYTFTNLTLGGGTYYFAYIVGNEISQSTLSTKSTAFVWSPNANSGTASALVYQWSTTAPTISGTSTYNWTTGEVTSPPSGWFTTISNTGTAAQTLWAAEVSVTAPVTGTTTSFSWTGATIIPFGYVGTTGASSRIAYTATNTTLNTTPNSYTVSGDNLPATGSWGTGIVWTATIPTLSAGQSAWQTDGVYNPTNNQTIWGIPYLSSLKVGNLSAISTNTGNLTVTGTFQSNTAAISGTTMTGSGGVLYPTGRFSFGDSTGNITYNGSALTLNGKVVAGGNISGGTISGSGWSGNVTLGGATLPVVFINRNVGSGSLYGLSVYESVTGSAYPLVQFDQSTNGLICLEVYNRGTSGGAANFYNTGSSKQGWVAPGAYSFYSPSGGGQIKITDGTAPFTGIHEGMLPLAETVEVGDIVVDSGLFYKLDISNCLFNVTKATSTNQVALGVLNSISPIEKMTPSALWESYTYEAERDGKMMDLVGLRLISPYTVDGLNSQYKVAAINALGEGQINVCGENGDIAVGDLIVTSSMAGKGMKQADDLIHSYTVAKAREAATFSSPTDVQMIACIYVSG